MQRRFEHISASIDDTDFLAGREFSPDGGSGIKAAETGAGRPDALDQRPLRHQFQLRFAFQIAIAKRRRRRVIGKRGHQLADESVLDQSAQCESRETPPRCG